MNEKETNDEVELNLLELVHALWKKAWLILLISLIVAGIAFGCTKVFIAPTYCARTTLFVNNKIAEEISKNSVSTNDLSASFHLVETYKVFLESRATLDEVISRIHLPYRYEELKKMVEVVAIEDTSAFDVTVTNENPKEAALIANTIGEVLPGKITDFIPGSSVKVVDRAVEPEKPVGPSAKKNAVLGALIGMVFSGGMVTVRMLADTQIHSEDDLKQNYDIPVLAVIPDLTDSDREGGYRDSAAFATNGKQGGKSHD